MGQALLSAGRAAFAEDLADEARPGVGERYVDRFSQDRPSTTPALKTQALELMRARRPANLYSPPPQGSEGFFFDLLAPGPASPAIAENVTAFSGNIDGLAAAMWNGDILVWSKWPRQHCFLPDRARVGRLAFAPDNPWLAACATDSPAIYLFDLNEPEKAALKIEPDCPGPVAWLGLSGKTPRLVLLDARHGLWIGPLTGPLQRVLSLGSRPLAMGLSANQGLAAAAMPSGEVHICSLGLGPRTRSFTVPGGPFDQALISENICSLTKAKTGRACWNIVHARPANPEELAGLEAPRLFLADDNLYFGTGLTEWSVTRKMIAPSLRLLFSKSKNVLKLRDIDGVIRYYGVPNGRPCEQALANDWVPVPGDGNGVHKVRGVDYILYDRVFQAGYQALNCRYVKDKGFFLWWRQAPASQDLEPRPGLLPARNNLRMDTDPEWIDLGQGELP
ncbi:MAG: hypothetical protein PHV85_01880 [Desulfovibrionaceae bacterium]|nr:hypothetical protein [Desulfovibrionaceae bacterium]